LPAPVAIPSAIHNRPAPVTIHFRIIGFQPPQQISENLITNTQCTRMSAGLKLSDYRESYPMAQARFPSDSVAELQFA
jgi:hypothetical protein